MDITHESYLVPFFREMNTIFPNKWCVLHSYETLPFYSESDVDMAFSGNDVSLLEAVITKVAHNQGWNIYQKLWYDVKSCYYYVLKHTEEDLFLAIDFLIDNDGIGKYGFKTSTLTTDCVMVKNLFPIPNPEVAFCYKLTKRIIKKRSLKEDRTYLVQQYEGSDTSKINAFLTKQFGNRGNNLIIKYLENENLPLTKSDIQSLKKRTGNRNLSLKYHFWEVKRIMNRFRFPSGIIVDIPELSKKESNLFCELLEKRIDILFRFTKLNVNNSAKLSFKGFIGSTLVICPKKNFNSKKALRFDWHSSKFISLPHHSDTTSNVEGMVDRYYIAILEALSARVSKKLLGT